MIHRQLARVLATGVFATGALAALLPAQAAQFEVVSQSIIVMRGIAPSKRSKPKPVVQQAAIDPDATVKQLTAEERRVLRYGVDELSSIEAAKAERKIEEPDGTTEVTVTMVPIEEPAAEPAVAEEAKPVVRQASFDTSNTTVTIEEAAPPRRTKWKSPASQKPDHAAMQAMERNQHEAEGGGAGE